MEQYEILKLMEAAAQVATTATLVAVGHSSSHVSLNEAYRLCGRALVKRWIAEGLIAVRKDGERTAKCRLERARLETLRQTNNRITYLTTEERKAH